MKEGFYAQLKVVFNKLTEAESRFHRSPQEMNQCKTIQTTSCSATQFGACVKGDISSAITSSPTHVQYGVFRTTTTRNRFATIYKDAVNTCTPSKEVLPYCKKFSLPVLARRSLHN